MKRPWRPLAFLVAGILPVVGGAAPAAAFNTQPPSPRLVFPLVQAGADIDTLIAVTRVDDDTIVSTGFLPIHLNFFDANCLIRDRLADLSPLDSRYGPQLAQARTVA